MCKKFVKNSHPFGKNCQKTQRGIFLTHTVFVELTRGITSTD